MEPAVRGARTEPTIVSNGVFCLSGFRTSKSSNGLVSLETVPPGTEFLDTETGGQKSTRAAVIVGGDRELKNRRQEPGIPLSTDPGRSCPSDCANGRTSSDQ